MRRCYIEEWDLYRIVRDFYADGKRFNGGETTTRMLFLGHADKDLRCVRFRHCWDHTPFFAQVDLAKYDGITEETDNYDVITFSKDEIVYALEETTVAEYYLRYGHPMKIELLGNGKTEVNAWLFYPSKEGEDFAALRPRIEEIYGIRFPASLADWYSEGVPFSVEKEWLFPDWLNLSEVNVAAIRQLISYPKEWLLRDVKKGMWHSAWGEQPNHPEEAVKKVCELFASMPLLIPVCGHRYMLCHEGNEDPPVISTVGYDTVLYGNNLKEYLKVEFEGGLLPDEAAAPNSMGDFREDE